jgi:transposase
MTDNQNNSPKLTLVAIDVAKIYHDALIQFPNGKTLQMKLENSLSGYQRLWQACCKENADVGIGFEPTSYYHRNIAFWFEQQGAQCHLVSSLSCAQAREMLYQT